MPITMVIMKFNYIHRDNDHYLTIDEVDRWWSLVLLTILTKLRKLFKKYTEQFRIWLKNIIGFLSEQFLAPLPANRVIDVIDVLVVMLLLLLLLAAMLLLASVIDNNCLDGSSNVTNFTKAIKKTKRTWKERRRKEQEKEYIYINLLILFKFTHTHTHRGRHEYRHT